MTALDELQQLLDQRHDDAGRLLATVRNLDHDDWVAVYTSTEQADREAALLACLLDADTVDRAAGQCGWDLDVGGGRPGFSVSWPDGKQQVDYLTIGADGVVPLVHWRTYDGPFPRTIELAEDFRLYWNLYEQHDAGRWVTTDEYGEVVVVAHRDGDTLRVRKSYLRRYQAARQLSLSLQFAATIRGGAELKDLADVGHEINNAEWRVTYYGGSLMFDDRHFARLLGKRILSPPSIDRAGVWPFEPARASANYIIGIDDNGEPVEYTSEPDKLANYFGANPDAPHFLTPVFFDRRVLDKYYGDPDRYRVEDGYISASGFWGLRVDNALRDHVAVFLGDLGGLPDREQQYWRSHNVHPPSDISETAIRRSFLAQFVDTDRVEYRFYAVHRHVNNAWEQRYGWPLFKPLHEGDAHLAHSLHVPTTTSFATFDAQLTGLAKFVVDSLNEEELSRGLSKVKDEKGIGKLERFLAAEGLDPSVCDTLRRVQGARSRSSAHRKGSDFDLTVLLNGAADLPTLFHDLLDALTIAFTNINAALTPPASPGGTP